MSDAITDEELDEQLKLAHDDNRLKMVRELHAKFEAEAIARNNAVLDDELASLKHVCEILKPLDNGARKRVLDAAFALTTFP